MIKYIIVFLTVVSINATTYYVRTDGNNANNGQADTAGGAWQTITQALVSGSGVPTTGGPHTLNIRTGTYTEASYLNMVRSYNALLTVQPTTGANDVIITGGSGNYTMLQGAAMANILFTNLTFTASASRLYLITFYTGAAYTVNNVTFGGCVFNSDSAGRHCLDFQNGSSTPAQSVNFINCIFNGNSSTFAAVNIPNTQTTVLLNMTNCTVNSRATTLTALAGGLNLSGCGFYGTGSGGIGLQIGVDGLSGVAVTGVVNNCSIKTPVSHGMLLGAGSTGVLVTNSMIYGGNYGAVLKHTVGSTVDHSTIHGGTLFALLLKGATNCFIYTNLITTMNNAAISSWDNDANYVNCGNSLVGNKIVTFGSGSVYYWPTNGDGGTNSVDYNKFTIYGSGKYGQIGSTVGITNLSDVKLLWTNDVNSQDVSAAGLIASPF